MDKKLSEQMLRQILKKFEDKASHEVEQAIQELHFLYNETTDVEARRAIKQYIDKFEDSVAGEDYQNSETEAYLGANFTPTEIERIKEALGGYIRPEDNDNITSIFKNKK